MTHNKIPDSGFLSGASDALRSMLGSISTERTLDKGEALFEQGDDAQELYALISGSMEVSVLAQDGRKLALNVMHAGALFGEIALFDPGERTATVIAMEPCTVRRIVYSDVLREIRREPELAIDLISLAGQRMRWMNRQLNEQVFLPVPSRLARKVLHLAPRNGELSLSQADLAEFVGATREAVSKTLATWKKLDVIEVSRGGMRVLDRSALQALAELDQI